jgi:hypothetical protein
MNFYVLCFPMGRFHMVFSCQPRLHCMPNSEFWPNKPVVNINTEQSLLVHLSYSSTNTAPTESENIFKYFVTPVKNVYFLELGQHIL